MIKQIGNATRTVPNLAQCQRLPKNHNALGLVECIAKLMSNGRCRVSRSDVVGLSR